MPLARKKVALFEDKLACHYPKMGRQGKHSQAYESRKNTDYTEEGPISKLATSDAKEESHKYDSLKVYREGPNSESGELDPRSDSKEVKKHNKSVAARNDNH
ncbi:uncharacterized protein N7469_002035 [Penicillium citrinum]|uniref:Uncharacterized protein n=1 Tax=Penicillium citrinum TaxID=5077 RepID=A0A9W9TUY5_PENCI|nr:uncharacterized protein N7469_002035 [Penicillium citrinum]KAJ5240444.1 hypothetical protein N7469_002035 [Penicillium citrinum]